MKERLSEYLRVGAVDAARGFLKDALAKTASDDTELRLRIKSNLGIVERKAGRFYDAIQALTEAEFLIPSTSNQLLIGNHRHTFGVLWQTIAEHEGIEEYNGRAVRLYEEAGECYEQAGATRELASTKNCIAYLSIQIGNIEDALRYATLAIEAAKPLGDEPLIAQFEHTRAQALLRDGKLGEALVIASRAAETLRAHRYSGVLPEVLATIGKITAAMREEVGVL